MLVKLLSATDKKHLLELLELLALADKPLLWEGKTKNEITSETDLGKLSIQKGKQETALIAELESEGKQSFEHFSGLFASAFGSSSVEARLLDKIKTFPVQKVEEPATRVQAATMILREMLEGKKFEFPSVSKLMLFELILMALSGGSISSIEWALLKEFQHHHQLEDFIFDDILERAETMNKEVSKTISIILE